MKFRKVKDAWINRDLVSEVYCREHKGNDKTYWQVRIYFAACAESDQLNCYFDFPTQAEGLAAVELIVSE